MAIGENGVKLSKLIIAVMKAVNYSRGPSQETTGF